ncbi:hypothetical protein SCHPADRAFT_345682 [Schizopora paradoxa]|uniref:G-protein coupled receptors family 1 profile domain-containing protein n=1 Tax=Schizopora paradoxa TaxID=27342 RepID=A0A0H2SA72_9AGAM|nr:hypothetical protein SCHPADRAFT_345682 [Schizopora paradoxa]
MEPVQIVYYVLPILGGHVGIPIALATIFFAANQSKRHPTFISFLISWSVFATSDLVLLYSGEEIRTPTNPPPHTLCLAQACMIYARFVLVALTSLALAFTLWLEMRLIRKGRDSTLLSVSLIWTPWISFLIVIIVSAVYGSLNPSALSTEGVFYCNFNTVFLSYFSSCVALACLIAILYFEGSILRVMWKSSRQFRQDKRPAFNLSMRVVVFTVYSFVTLVIILILTFTTKVEGLNVFIASLPLAAFLIFGTQRENLCVWFGACAPTLNSPYASAIVRRWSFQKRTTNEDLQFTRLAERATVTVDPGVIHPDFAASLDKRLPKTPTNFDEM